MTVTLTLSAPPPAIALAPTSATFTAVAGGANPASQTVAVTNGGGGTLSDLAVGTIAYGAGATGWLTTATLNTTTAPATLTLQPATGSLVAGTYTATVPITSAVASNSPQNVTVTFTVSAPPSIVLTPTSATFTSVAGGANPASQAVAVTNGGGGTLSGLAVGTIAYGAGATGWLTTATLNTTTAPATLTLQPATGSLVAGTYTATVPLTSGMASNSPQNLSVTFTVSAPPPAIVLTPTSRTFTATQAGSNPASQTVSVTNGGGGTLSNLAVGTITYGIGATGWLTTATLNTTTAPATLTLQPATGSLVAGTYTATVPITSGVASNSPQNVSVTFTVSATPPSIVLTPTSRTFSATRGGGNPASQTVSVTNGGGGTLSGLSVGTISYGTGATGWLTSATLDNTTAPATLTLQPTTGSLAPGTYTATVPIVATFVASNSPQNVSVTFTVSAPPSIRLMYTTFYISATQGGGDPASGTVSVTNGGGGTLSGLAIGTITYGAGASGWLQASVSPATAPATVTLTATLGSLAAGSYTATVPVTSSAAGVTNSPQNITVTFAVQPPATIAVLDTPVTLAVTVGSATPATKTFRISNAGGGTLNWRLSDDASWLTLSRDSGATSAGSYSTVTATASAGSLTVGRSTGTVTVTAPGATNTPQSAPVILIVAPVYDGTWAGRTGLDSTIALQIVNNRISVVSFGWGGVAACGGSVSGHYDNLSLYPNDVTSGIFTGSGSNNPITYTISGTFGSATAVSGTLYVSFSAPCGSGSRSTTWSAARQ